MTKYRFDGLPALKGDYRQRFTCYHCTQLFPSHTQTQKYCCSACRDAAFYLKRRTSQRTTAQYAYVNRVMDGTIDVCVKFGIESRPGARSKNQNNKSPHNVTTLFCYRFSNRALAWTAESECKRELECGILSKGDMPDGYTETTYCYNIDKIRAIYEKHGGILVT